MNTWYNRLCAIFTMTVMLGIGAMACVAFSSWILYADLLPKPMSIELHDVLLQKSTDGYYKTRVTELAYFRFGIKADFAPVFTWNTKQVFAFVTVEYENQEFGRNEIVIWDKIIRQTDSHLVDDYNLSSEYNIADIKQALPGTKAKLTLKWSVTHWTGPILDYAGPSAAFSFPDAASVKSR